MIGLYSRNGKKIKYTVIKGEKFKNRLVKSIETILPVSDSLVFFNDTDFKALKGFKGQ